MGPTLRKKDVNAKYKINKSALERLKLKGFK